MVRERVQMIKQCNITARTECTELKWTGRKLENSGEQIQDIWVKVNANK